MDYLERGAVAGGAGGLLYGLYLGTIGTAFTAGLETVEEGHGGGAVVPDPVTAVTSVGGGVLWGLLLGVVVFGGGYYLFEPALPGEGLRQRLVLAAAGFLVVSGAPWTLLPPQAPGVEQSLSTDARVALYAGGMVLGAVVVGLSWAGYRWSVDRGSVTRAVSALLPLALLPLVALVVPSNTATGAVPAALVMAYRGTVVLGQVVLWVSVAVVHSRLPADRAPGTDPPVAVAD